MQPYAELGYRHFGDNPYAVAGSFGVNLQAGIGASVLTADFSGGYRDVFETRETPGRNNMDAAQLAVSVGLSTPFSETLTLDVGLNGAAVNAAKDFEDHFALGVDGAVTKAFDVNGRQFFASLGGGAVYSNYSNPGFRTSECPERGNITWRLPVSVRCA